jgi:hypothetical protein
MKPVPEIQIKIRDLEQEELYLKTCIPLGSQVNEIGTYAEVTNGKAHAVNMKVYNFLEVNHRRQLEWTRTIKTNMKNKMEINLELNHLLNLGF